MNATDQQDTPVRTEDKEENTTLVPTPLHLMHLPHHGPGPELNSSEMKMQRITLLHSHAQSSVINNNMPRTSEPDNDDCCIQPEHLRKLKPEDSIREGVGGGGGGTTSGGDNSTIMSYRTGTDTMDTDTTIQRGSRSKKPSPDPDVQPQPIVRKNHGARDVPGAIEQSPHNYGGALHHVGRDNDMPSSLSFPSPPSVNDEELPTQKTSSACASVSVLQERLSESLSSSSNRTGGNNSHNNRNRNNGKSKDMSSSRKRLYIVLVAAAILIIVITVSMKVTKKNEDDHDKKGEGRGHDHHPHHHNNDKHHHSKDDNSSDDWPTKLVPSAAPSTRSEPELLPTETNTDQPTTAPSSTLLDLEDTTNEIVLQSATIASLVNETGSNPGTEGEAASESPSSLVLAEQPETTTTTSPTTMSSQYAPSTAPAPSSSSSSSLRGGRSPLVDIVSEWEP